MTGNRSYREQEITEKSGARSLLIIGAGSFSPEIDELARLCGYTDTAFLDDHPEEAYIRPVVGTMADIGKLRETYDTAIVALGNNEHRMKYHALLKEYHYNIPVLIHPTAYVSPDAELSPGCIIRTYAVVSRYVQLGEACILNIGALTDHHVVLGEGCHVMMGAVIRNKAVVPPLTKVPCNGVIE